MTTVIVANDLVGFGKVSLTSSLPIMSAYQTEVLPLPTVLLSSHTSEFDNIYVRYLGLLNFPNRPPTTSEIART